MKSGMIGFLVMIKFLIRTKEVWIQVVEVEANSEEEAIRKVEEGEGICSDNDFEFSYMLDSDEWEVEKDVPEEVLYQPIQCKLGRFLLDRVSP